MTARRTFHEVEDAFLETLEVEAALRPAFLDRRCAGDAEFRSSVEQLLVGHDAAEPQFIAPPETAPKLPARIGRYRVVGLIASGGMGAVYEAEQESPRRTVAIKVLRAGFGSPSLARRFAQESEVLARLRHAGIAQVYESGVFDDGSGSVPFFAMEFVPDALSITDFARELPIRERLTLFLRVCDAVLHGHQRGVIHRDLKPGNILIDRAGAPKIIDFGIARSSDASADSMHTSAGQLIGTVAYMSPEQCAADPSAIDIRTDVYSLGVVLFELLCGRPPFDPSGRSILDVARSIREDPTPRPSAINPALRGDLEIVILTAIERDPSRRYQSVVEFAADIKRFLGNEPISARPATTIYQLRMFARRNRALAIGVVIALTGLLAGVAGAAWQAVIATRERNSALVAQTAAGKAAAKAEDEADTARRIAACLQNAIASLDPNVAMTEGVSRAAVLHASAEAVARELKGKPAAQAELFHRLGLAYLGLGLDTRARELLESANRLLTQQGADPVALASVREVLAKACERSGDKAEAKRLCADVLRLTPVDDYPRRIRAGRSLAALCLMFKELPEAQKAAEDAVQTAANAGTPALDVRCVLAQVLEARGSIDAARDQYRRYLEEAEGVSLEDVSLARHVYATFELRQGRKAEADALLASARKAWHDARSPRTLDAAHMCTVIAESLQTNSLWSEAEPFLREAIERYTEAVGPRNSMISKLDIRLADALQYLGRSEEAVPLYRDAVNILRLTVGDEHPDVGACLYHLARIAAASHDEPALHRLREDARQLNRACENSPANHPHRSGTLLLVGLIDMSLGDLAIAERSLRECVRLRLEQIGPDARITAYAQTVLGGCLTRMAQFEEAEAILLDSVPRVAAKYIPGSFMITEARHRLVDLYTAWGKPEQAEAARHPAN